MADGDSGLTNDGGIPPLTDDSGLGPGSAFPEIDGNQLQTLSDKDLLSIGEECEEWPVQKVCTFIVRRSIKIQWTALNSG